MSLNIEGLTPLIQVFDMPASVAFYCDVLGFVIDQQAPQGDVFDWALLRKEGVGLMLNTAYEMPHRPSTPDPIRTAAHGDTAFFFGCRDLDAAHRHLVERGIPVDPPTVVPYGMRQLWLKDPDGYSICFQWPAT